MRTLLGRAGRRTLVLAVVALAAAVAVARAAIPDGGTHVYHACLLGATGTIRMIDPSLGARDLRGHCTTLEREITWNEAGSPGTPGPQGTPGLPGAKGDKGEPGVSVASTPLAPGDDASCPNGGSKFVSASGVTYACNGESGGESVHSGRWVLPQVTVADPRSGHAATLYGSLWGSGTATTDPGQVAFVVPDAVTLRHLAVTTFPAMPQYVVLEVILETRDGQPLVAADGTAVSCWIGIGRSSTLSCPSFADISVPAGTALVLHVEEDTDDNSVTAIAPQTLVYSWEE